MWHDECSFAGVDTTNMVTKIENITYKYEDKGATYYQYFILDTYVYIKNDAWVTVNNNFCHEWGDSALIFMSDEVTSENHCRIPSRVTNKIVIHGSECIILFLARYFMSWTQIR